MTDTYDDYSPNNPVNQTDSEPDQIETLEQAFKENDSERFYELLSEITKDVNLLRELAKSTNKLFMYKKLNNIYQKL